MRRRKPKLLKRINGVFRHWKTQDRVDPNEVVFEVILNTLYSGDNYPYSLGANVYIEYALSRRFVGTAGSVVIHNESAENLLGFLMEEMDSNSDDRLDDEEFIASIKHAVDLL